MSTGIRVPPGSDDPLTDRLAKLAHETEHPGIERVAREALGKPAAPTASDRLSTLYQSDGWLVARVETADAATLIRRCPPESGFERCSTVDGELVRQNVGRFGVKALFERFEVEWVLFGDIENRFEAAVDERRWGEGVFG